MLQVENTQEGKFTLIDSMADDALPPIYVLSHKRADNLVTYARMPWLRGESLLVVAHGQEADYRAAGWGDNLLVIPAGFGGSDVGIGRALQYILDHAERAGHETIITVHDDLKSINVLYEVPELGKVSRAYAGIVDDAQRFFRGCFALMGACAGEAFAEYETAVIASPQVNNANRTLRASQVRWELNAGGNPAQLQYWRVDRYKEYVGRLNLAEFNIHGEDISLACDIIEAGCQVVNLPTFISDYLDYETESVIRDPETAPALRLGEHLALMKKTSMAPYIKTRRDILGRPQWHSLAWPLLKRDGRALEDQALWTDEDRIPSLI